MGLICPLLGVARNMLVRGNRGFPLPLIKGLRRGWAQWVVLLSDPLLLEAQLPDREAECHRAQFWLVPCKSDYMHYRMSYGHNLTHLCWVLEGKRGACKVCLLTCSLVCSAAFLAAWLDATRKTADLVGE